MLSLTSVARPYAKAIMSLASRDKNYAAWSQVLRYLSLLLQDSDVQLLIHDHTISAQQKADFLISIKEDMLSEQAKNLLRVMAYHARLAVIPELYKLYESMRMQEEQKLSMDLIVAEDIDSAAVAKLSQEISAKLQKHITIEPHLDIELIGGGKLKIGDRVIESSIKASLQDLYLHLMQ